MIGPRGDSVGYRELAALLRGQIASGGLPPGARVPSESDLVQLYGCSRTTVRRAVQLLREEGLVVVRHGYPTRVREQPERDEVRLQRGARLVVRAATGDERDELGTAMVAVVDYLGGTLIYAADRHVFVYR